MALARTYYSVNGEIIGEHRQGEANSRDYIRDSLGNVTAVYQNDWEIAEAIYKPYGQMFSNWNFTDYRFGWNGAHGYRRTRMAWTTHYVRARHYSQIGANWTTRDPLWPFQMPYGYVNGMAMSANDPSGKLGCRVTRRRPTSNCGGFLFENQWVLGKYERVGWIVQHVKMVGEFQDCKGNLLVPVKNFVIEYWEAWRVLPVKQGQESGIYRCKKEPLNITNSLNHDSFVTPDIGLCTSGKITITGIAKFISQADSDMLSEFRCGVPVHAGNLLGYDKWPIGWDERSDTIKKSLEVKFSCCCQEECKDGEELVQSVKASCG